MYIFPEHKFSPVDIWTRLIFHLHPTEHFLSVYIK